MARRTGRFYKKLKEKVVALREIPESLQKDCVTGNYTFGTESFPKNGFELIVSEEDDREMVILQGRNFFDEEGITISETEYNGTAIPPIPGLRKTDIIVRIEKKYQTLYIENINPVLGVQQFELELRNRASDEGD